MSFNPFGDFDTRGYLRNVFADKTPEIVKLKEHNAFRMHVGEALDALAARPSLKYQDVLDTHRRLFSDYYPWAGQDRAAILPDLAVGKAGRYDLFSHPQDCQRAVEYGIKRGATKPRCARSQARSWACSLLVIPSSTETAAP
jgi:cell filamentation protein